MLFLYNIYGKNELEALRYILLSGQFFLLLLPRGCDYGHGIIDTKLR